MVKFADPSGDKPLYDQLATLLKTTITKDMHEGDMLPTERDLSIQYGVSRTTVRIALQKLESLGYVNRWQGKGTFVAKNKTNSSLYTDELFAKQTLASGQKLVADILKVEIVAATESLAKMLLVNQGEKLLEVSRVWQVKKTPFVFERIYLVFDKYKDISIEMLEKMDLSEIFLEKYNEKVGSVEDKVSIRLADEKEAEILSIAKDSSLLEDQQTVYNSENKVLNVSVMVAIPNEFSFLFYREVK